MQTAGIVCLVAVAVAAPLAQSPPPPKPPAAPPLTYRAPFAKVAPTLDGKLDDAAWRDAPWTSDFVDIEGPTKPTPRYRTRAKLMWDETYLYIGAELAEPHVWATYSTRDSIVFHENDFEVFIDPNGDGKAYYELEVNCLGTIFDLYLARKYRDEGPAVHRWDCKGLRTAIHVAGTPNDPRDTDKGWSLEWAIPWSALVPPSTGDDGSALPTDDGGERARGGAAPSAGDAWRINFSRVQWRHIEDATRDQKDGAAPSSTPPPYAKLPDSKEDNWVWSPQWVVDMHLPDRWGIVTFVR